MSDYVSNAVDIPSPVMPSLHVEPLAVLVPGRRKEGTSELILALLQKCRSARCFPSYMHESLLRTAISKPPT